MRRFGSVQVRACGTVGGNIANGSPIGDLAPVMIALGASASCARAMKSADFRSRIFLAYGRQRPRARRIRRRLSVPKLTRSTHFRGYKVSKRSTRISPPCWPRSS